MASVGYESAQLPIRLRIPKIGVDALIEHVGVTPDGAMDVPKTPEDAAWFDAGSLPGEEGSAVIDGHSGRKGNALAVFDNLYKLKKGDKIYTEDGKGTMTVFTVRETRDYDPGADAESVFNSPDGRAHLNLITCAGTWDEIEKTHTQRLVVFADKEI